MLLLTGSQAAAAPVKDLNDLPAELQKYVPGSPAFANAPWMTSPVCKDKGGDFSAWTASVINDTPSLLAHFQSSAFGKDAPPQDKPRNDAILAGYRQIAAEVSTILPAGYCVDDMKRWTSGIYDSDKPFSFPWGQVTKDAHQSSYYCIDRGENSTRELDRNRYLGAERVPCDGVYISCAGAQGADKARCDRWNGFSDEYIRRVEVKRGQAINDHKAEEKSETKWAVKSVDWFDDITKVIATGAAYIMGEAMTWWTRTDRSEMLETPGIAKIHEMLRYIGIALLVGGVIWQGLVMMVKRKIDPLISTATGLVSFVAWSTIAGTLAVLINEAGVALANQVLDESLPGFAKAMGDSLLGGIAAQQAGAAFFLSLVLALLSCVQWGLGFFRQGAIVVLLAIIPTAAAGQVGDATKPWLKKVLSWCLALLLYQPIAAVIFAIGMKLVEGATGLGTSLLGIAVLILAVVSMPTMMRFFDWGGQKIVSGGGGGGGAMALGAGASMLGGGGGIGRMMDRSGPGGKQNAGNPRGSVPVASATQGNGPDGGNQSGPQGKPPNSPPSGGPQGKPPATPQSGGQPGVPKPGAGGMPQGAAGTAATKAHPAAMAADVAVKAGQQALNQAKGAMTDGPGSGGKK
ncbi:hypothetical protein D5S17_35825 [Pseudonocardiaceae bacterium YIM PH 21723]|nr:hypothetical protein D5S17_35825 [Pseudonocardiaceae bacterium YIM PH 21723]